MNNSFSGFMLEQDCQMVWLLRKIKQNTDVLNLHLMVSTIAVLNLSNWLFANNGMSGPELL